MTFRPIPEASRALEVAPRPSERPHLEGGPSALRRGNRDRFPGPGDKDGLDAASPGDAPGQDPCDLLYALTTFRRFLLMALRVSTTSGACLTIQP